MTGGEILTTLADLIGKDLTMLLLARRGGEEVYIPTPGGLTPDHWLSLTVGFDAAMKVAGYYQGVKISLPLGPESGSRNALHRAVRESAAAGASVNEIVRATGIHSRTVRRIKNRRGLAGLSTARTVDPRQRSLFGNLTRRHDKD